MEWTRRDLDKNSFESKDHNLNLIIQSLQVKGFAKKKLQNSDSFVYAIALSNSNRLPSSLFLSRNL
jgi:hypothetical protein